MKAKDKEILESQHLASAANDRVKAVRAEIQRSVSALEDENKKMQVVRRD